MATRDEPKETKNMTLRLDRDLADRVHAVAEVEGTSVSEVVRQALVEHVDRRRQDPEFRQLVRHNIERHQRLLKMLADA